MDNQFYLLRQVCPIQTLPDKVLLRILGFIPHKVETKHLYINGNVHDDIERKYLKVKIIVKFIFLSFSCRPALAFANAGKPVQLMVRAL